MQRDEQVVNCTALEMEDGLADDEREEEAVVMLEESPSGIVMTTNLFGTYSLPYNGLFFPAISRISAISDFFFFHKILIIRVSEVRF